MNEQLTVPKCFSDKTDYVMWLQFDRASNTGRTFGFVCKDCTPIHQEEMMRQGRCEHPDFKFGHVRVKVAKEEGVEYTGYIQTERGRLTNGYALSNGQKPQVAA